MSVGNDDETTLFINCLKKYYEKVIERFGRENMIGLLQMMKQSETIMSSEMEEMEEAGCYEK